jgi:hypothetical protein
VRLDDAPLEVVAAATRLRNGLLEIFGDRLLGYYFGSVATGAYEAGTSDIDTLAVLASDAGGDETAVLERMHESLVLETPSGGSGSRSSTPRAIRSLPPSAGPLPPPASARVNPSIESRSIGGG